MPDSVGLVLNALTYVILVAVFLYAAYWAFAIRRALVSRIYRSHALWLGVLCVVLLTSVVVSLIPASGAVGTALSDVPVIAVILGFFAFADSTVPIARRSDPLLRDILSWNKLRVGGWFLIVLVEVFGLYIDLVGTSGSTGFGAGFGGLLLFLIGAPPMLVGARRSKDPNLRGSLKWFGMSLLFFIGVLLVAIIESALGISNSDMSSIPYAAVLVLVGYSLYRSARSLAPINRLQAIDPVIASPAVAARI